MLRDDVQAISVDDHVVEPPHVFVDHIEPKFRDRAPRIVERDGAEGWLWEDRFYPLTFQGNAQTRKFRAGEAGRGDDLYARRYEDMIPAAYDVHERVRAMDEDGVWAELLFPTFPRFGGTQFLAGRRQGPRAGDGARVERLDDRRVVRGVPGAVHPADARPAVGRAGGGRRDRAVRRQGLACGALRREPAPARAAVVPDRALASGVRGVQRRPACRCRCTSARRRASSARRPRRTPSVGIALCGVNSMSALGDLIFSGVVQRLAELPGRAVGRRRGLGAVRARAARLHVGAQPLRGPREHRAAVGGVRGARLGVHDLRPVRDPEPRPDRRRQDHVGGRLPAQRLELAEQPQDPGRRAASTSPTTKRARIAELNARAALPVPRAR